MTCARSQRAGRLEIGEKARAAVLAGFVISLQALLGSPGASAATINHVKINDEGWKLTRAVAQDKAGVDLFGQTTAGSVLNFPDVHVMAVDQRWNRIVYFDPDDDWIRSIGEGLLDYPVATAVDNFTDVPIMARLYVADFGNDRIAEFNYLLDTYYGFYLEYSKDLTGPSDPPIAPWAVATFDTAGMPTSLREVRAGDNSAHRIVKYLPNHPDGGLGIRYSYGEQGGGIGQFEHIEEMTWGRDPLDQSHRNNDYLYVADGGNSQIVRLRRQEGTGNLLWDAVYELPSGVWLTALTADAFGNIYWADHYSSQITAMDGDFNVLATYGSVGTGQDKFVRITDLAMPPHQANADLVVVEDWSDSTGCAWLMLGVESNLITTVDSTHFIDFEYDATGMHYLTIEPSRFQGGQWVDLPPTSYGLMGPFEHLVRWEIPSEDVGYEYLYHFRVVTESPYQPAYSDASEYEVSMGNYVPTITDPISLRCAVNGCFAYGVSYLLTVAAVDSDTPGELTYSWSADYGVVTFLHPGLGIWTESVTGPWDTLLVRFWAPTEPGDGGSVGPLDRILLDISDQGGGLVSLSRVFDLCTGQSPLACPYQGDANADGWIEATDLAIMTDVVFFGVPSPQDPDCPMERLDWECNGFVDATDLSFMIDYVFGGGDEPCNPCTD